MLLITLQRYFKSRCRDIVEDDEIRIYAVIDCRRYPAWILYNNRSNRRHPVGIRAIVPLASRKFT